MFNSNVHRKGGKCNLKYYCFGTRTNIVWIEISSPEKVWCFEHIYPKGICHTQDLIINTHTQQSDARSAGLLG